MNLSGKRIKTCKKTQPVTTVRLSGASKEGQTIVISQVQRPGQQGKEVFIVVKRNDGKPMQAEVKIVAPPADAVVCVEGVRRDVKNIMTAIEVVNKRIEIDERDRQRLLSMCTD